MLRLNNSDLPATTENAAPKAPLLRVTGYANRPPFAQVGTYANYGLRPGFTPTKLGLPDPAYVGRYFRLVFNASTTESFTVSAVSRVSLNGQPYSILRDGIGILGALPQQAWANAASLSLYAPIGTQEGDTVTVQLTVNEQIPLPDENINYTIDLSEFVGSRSFAVSRAVSEGLSFTLADNPGNPQTGELVQTGNSITLYGATNYQPRAFRSVQIESIWQAPLDALGAVLVTFDLAPLSVGVVDELTYLGIVCRPTRDRYSLAVGDLLATRSFATCCVPYNRALWVRSVAEQAGNYTSRLADLSYQSSVT